MAIVQAVVGGITGLDGSGFSGLPLVGTLAQALGSGTKLDVATLGAVGQYFAVVVGGGTIIPWAVIPAAAITGTDPVEIARRNLVPTLAGLVGVIICGHLSCCNHIVPNKTTALPAIRERRRFYAHRLQSCRKPPTGGHHRAFSQPPGENVL